jgi:hypothetical protein
MRLPSRSFGPRRELERHAKVKPRTPDAGALAWVLDHELAEGTSTISIFEDREGAEESSRAAAAWLAENLPDLNVAAPYVTAGDVLISF